VRATPRFSRTQVFIHHGTVEIDRRVLVTRQQRSVFDAAEFFLEGALGFRDERDSQGTRRWKPPSRTPAVASWNPLLASAAGLFSNPGSSTWADKPGKRKSP
jgi:hypothetical protein